MAMRLARLRRFAVMLVLVLCAGLAMPALSTPPRADRHAAHVHGGGMTHIHAGPDRPAAEQAGTVGTVPPVKRPLHCPDCLTTADCALSCLGIVVLPASVQPPAGSIARSWVATLDWPSLAFMPASDLDPPRPVLVR